MEKEQLTTQLKQNWHDYLLNLGKDGKDKKLTPEEEQSLTQDIVALEQSLSVFQNYPPGIVMNRASQMMSSCPRAARVLPLEMGMHLLTSQRSTKKAFEVI
jgi:hypothetical protein